MKKLLSLAFIVVCAFHTTQAFSTSEEANAVIKTLEKTQADIISYEEKNGISKDQILFIAFWNFDNTILNGDATDGFASKDKNEAFKGLLEIQVDKGMSKEVNAKNFEEYYEGYEALIKVDPVAAYLSPIQIFAGANPQEMLAISREAFNTEFKYHFFKDAIQVLNAMNDSGVRSYVITASPWLFTRGAAETVGIPENQIYGVEVAVVNGVLTKTLVLPTTTGKGKIDKINLILKDIEAEMRWKKIYILAGIGNNNINDLPFLHHISCLKFPVGSPIVVIVKNSKNKLVESVCGSPFLFHSKEIVGQTAEVREMAGSVN